MGASLTWDDLVAAARRRERLVVTSAGVLQAQGDSFMDGDKVCVRCAPNTGAGVRCYTRTTINGLDFVRSAATRQPKATRKQASPTLAIPDAVVVELAKKSVDLVFYWTKNRRMALLTVTLRSPPTAPARQLLTDVVSTTDGTYKLPLGRFTPGPIKVGFDLRALDDIPKAQAYLAKDGHPDKFLPRGSGSKKLKRGQKWIASGSRYQV